MQKRGFRTVRLLFRPSLFSGLAGLHLWHQLRTHVERILVLSVVPSCRSRQSRPSFLTRPTPCLSFFGLVGSLGVRLSAVFLLSSVVFPQASQGGRRGSRRAVRFHRWQRR